MGIILDNNNANRQDYEEMIPFFSIASKNFDQDLVILKKVLHQLSKECTQKVHINSVGATLASQENLDHRLGFLLQDKLLVYEENNYLSSCLWLVCIVLSLASINAVIIINAI